jgi:hypothetical protein
MVDYPEVGQLNKIRGNLVGFVPISRHGTRILDNIGGIVPRPFIDPNPVSGSSMACIVECRRGDKMDDENLVAWQKEGLPPLRLAVNISAQQFYRGDIVGTLAGCGKMDSAT